MTVDQNHLAGFVISYIGNELTVYVYASKGTGTSTELEFKSKWIT